MVGQAESFDPLKEEDLRDFHEKITSEEERGQLEKNLEMTEALSAKQAALAKMGGKDAEAARAEIEELKRELLSLPKRDRFAFEIDGKQQYDTNISRQKIHEEKGDSVFDVNGVTLFDLSGRKTDLRFEVAGGKQWNIHYSEKDFWQAEERIRYRRRYFRKILHSLQSRLARHSSKAVEIDDEKVRYDSIQNSAYNYAFSRKFSINFENQMTHRQFVQEPFDQDSSWEGMTFPSLFWNLTPKSRVSGGYRFAANRIRSKTGDTNAHEMHVNYFGAFTRKSSLSLDLGYSRQVPRSIDTARTTTYTAGIGYIYQLTPKSQLTAQIIRSLQNTTSNATNAAEASGSTDSTKTDTHFSNDSLSLSLNTRFTAKLTMIATANISHTKTEINTTDPDTDTDPETQQVALPFSINFTYLLHRLVRLQTGYSFSYRTGDEKQDKNRSHLWSSSMHITL